MPGVALALLGAAVLAVAGLLAQYGHQQRAVGEMRVVISAAERLRDARARHEHQAAEERSARAHAQAARRAAQAEGERLAAEALAHAAEAQALREDAARVAGGACPAACYLVRP